MTGAEAEQWQRGTLTRTTTTRVLGYLRVNTEQADSGAGRDAQRMAITVEAAQRGWTIVAWHSDEAVSGSKPADDRPAGHAALVAMRIRKAATLLVSKSDRLTRSVHDLTGLVAWGEPGWVGVDRV